MKGMVNWLSFFFASCEPQTCAVAAVIFWNRALANTEHRHQSEWGLFNYSIFFFFVAFYSGLLIFLEKTYEISIPADTTTVGETLWSMLHLGRLYMISITRHLIYIYICYSLRHHSSETKKEKTVWQHCLWMTVFW